MQVMKQLRYAGGFMLYSERNHLRPRKNYTDTIDVNVYNILINCCGNYIDKLVNIFPMSTYDDFTGESKVVIDYESFTKRVLLKIPTLFHGQTMNGDSFRPETFDNYDQFALLDFIEYLGSMLKDETNSFTEFKLKINDIFSDAGVSFELTDNSEVLRIEKNTTAIDSTIQKSESIHDSELHNLLKMATDLYYKRGLDSRKTSLETLWGAFERVKTVYTDLDKKDSVEKLLDKMAQGNIKVRDIYDNEFKELTYIGNQYSIRHHETNQSLLTDNDQYDYLFCRCIALINVALNFCDE